MDFLDILKQKAFLGREFLTYLWFKSDQHGGRIELPGSSVVEVFFLDRMTLDLSDADSPQTVALKGGQSELREGMAALKEGKKIEEARISLRAQDNEFIMILKGSWFSFSSFKTPPMLPASERGEEDDTESRFLEKVYLVEEGTRIIDSLFELFLMTRLSDDWEKSELPRIRKWINSYGA
jgi:hypothetical protein